MKKTYIAPALDIEKIDMMQNFMLTISTGEPFAEGEEGIADIKEIQNVNVDTDIEF